jgi:hypothetical protein
MLTELVEFPATLRLQLRPAPLSTLLVHSAQLFGNGLWLPIALQTLEKVLSKKLAPGVAGVHTSTRPGGLLFGVAEHPTEWVEVEKPNPLSEFCR